MINIIKLIRNFFFLKLFFFLIFLVLINYLYGTLSNSEGFKIEDIFIKSNWENNSSFLSIISFKILAIVISFISFGISLFLKFQINIKSKSKILISIFLLLSFSVLFFWLPEDIIDTKQVFLGKSLFGESPSISAYIGKVFILILMVFIIPISIMNYFSLRILDRYVAINFLFVLAFSFISLISVWIIADLTDSGGSFAGLPFSWIFKFYISQIPLSIMLIMPVSVMISSFFVFRSLSKSNEFISIVGIGISPFRIFIPIFVIGIYISIILIGLNYEWAPKAEEKKNTIYKEANEEKKIILGKKKKKKNPSIWMKNSWMYVNELSKRSWFIKLVPLELSKPMKDVIICQFNPKNDLEYIWKIRRAKWVPGYLNKDKSNSKSYWELSDVYIHDYREGLDYEIKFKERVNIYNWEETPWMLLSSAKDPEKLGIIDLTAYIKMNNSSNKIRLSPYKTQWWNIFASSFGAFVLMLVAVPLGVLYNQRDSDYGMIVIIAILCLFYIFKSVMISIGNMGIINPIVASFGPYIIVGLIGIIILIIKNGNKSLFVKK